MSYPIIKGIVVHERDVEKIREISMIKEKEKEKRLILLKKKQGKTTWKQLIRKVKII